jgi:hypothetical protein
MADVKISALGAIAAVAGEDLIAIVDDPSVTPASRKATMTQVLAFINANISALANIVEDTTPDLGGTLTGSGFDQTGMGTISMTEQAAANADVAGDGQVWVKTATPNQIWFTDDAGTDFQLSSLAGTETLTNKSIDSDNNTITNIVNADVKSSAAIAYSKLAALTDGNILVGNGSNVATSVNPSGDVDVTNAGVFSISSGAIVNADVNASAAIAYSKLNLSSSIVTGDIVDGTIALADIATAAKTEALIIAAGDETTAITVADGKTEFQMPYAFTLTEVRATLTTAGTTSGVTTIDIEDDGSTIFSTLLTIDSTEKTSTSAATPAVISGATLADGSIIKVNVDVLSGGATEAGLKIYLIGYQT